MGFFANVRVDQDGTHIAFRQSSSGYKSRYDAVNAAISVVYTIAPTGSLRRFDGLLRGLIESRDIVDNHHKGNSYE